MHGSPAPATFDVGATIAGTYRIESQIGRGGMGMVFLASHRRLPGKQVAIKVLRADLSSDEMLARFKREAEIVSLLAHPNIVHVEDFNVTPDGTPYLVLEYLQGESLAERLSRGPLSIELTLSIARQVGSALAAAHARGIVHRDLKPQNIFLVPTEIDGHRIDIAKVLDFGISKLLDSQTVRTEEDALLGTPQYMAPEQATGRHTTIDVRTDVFALGTIVYEMLSGHPAFTGTSIPEVVYKVVHEQPEPLPSHVPGPIASAVRQAMSKSAAERFSTAGSFIEALTGTQISVPAEIVPAGGGEALAQTIPSENRVATPTIPTPMVRRVPTRVIVGCAALAAAIAAGTVYFAMRRGTPERLDHDRMHAVAIQLMAGSAVELGGRTYRVGQIGRDHLKNVKFSIGGHGYEAIEQNPAKDSKWGELARQGHAVVQFKDLATNAYIGVVVDGVSTDLLEP